MNTKKTVTAVMILGCFFSCNLIAEERNSGAKYFVEKSTWAESMLASREVYLQNCTESVVSVDLWHITAPMQAKGFTDVFFPEKKVDLNAKDENGNAVWTKKPKWQDGIEHELAGGSNAMTYLYRTINSDKAKTVSALFACNDGIVIWLNGKKLMSHSRHYENGSLNLPLIAGTNKLLMKVHNISSYYCFTFDVIQNSAALKLWDAIKKKYPVQCDWMMHELGGNWYIKWFSSTKKLDIEKKMIESVLDDVGIAGKQLKKEYELLNKQKVSNKDCRWLNLYAKSCSHRINFRQLDKMNFNSLRLAIKDLYKTFPDKYKGKEYLERLDKIEHLVAQGGTITTDQIQDVSKLQSEALLTNPLLNFDKLLFVKRKNVNKLGLPQNWQGNCALPRKGYDDEICVLSPVIPQANYSTLYKPERDVFVGDVDLNFDADKMLFSSIGTNNRWHIFELKSDGTGLRQLTPQEGDIDNYDACYLPDGRIIFDSTSTFQGIPCVTGGDYVANLYIMDENGKGIRQLAFDQDHNWYPVMTNNGRVMFSRWEYSDTPHYFSRLVMTMNPDGTDQKAYYGSNSYWPNSTFYARPIPNHPTKFVAVISGHHGVARMGELIIFDPAIGRFEADGVVQRIPGFGKKVEPVIADKLVDKSWPKFLHPYPLSDKYFLVSCKPTPQSLWGIYLVDIFDNMLLLAEAQGYSLLEPIPFRKTKRPPVIPDRIDLEKDDATVYLVDIYFGDGLKDVPRGEVKKLRLYEFHYSYRNMGGHKHVGVEGPWDVHRIMGTVPVYPDGSALFKIPANTPVAVQPLDAEGNALQVMKSWFVGMPGENVSCVGCHESQNSGPPSKRTTASTMTPSKIKPWHGPTRGFSFKRDVQEPVLLKYCVGCHDGSKKGRLDLSVKNRNGWNNFTPAYLALHPYVRRPGPESDYHPEKPMEYHSNTSELIQMLKKGHHGVKLDPEAWDRLVTWIDLNVPDHGTWGEHRGIPHNGRQRRIELRTKYANRPEDPEMIPVIDHGDVKFIKPKPAAKHNQKKVTSANWPFDEATAKKLQKSAVAQKTWTINLGNGVKINMVLIPAGEFVMGRNNGALDERPLSLVRIDKPFWMAETEITNQQFRRFDSSHDNGYFNQQHKDHTRPGYFAGKNEHPVIRVSWQQAVEFCKWLSDNSGLKVTLPTEAQWEWACRAGSDQALSFGDVQSDFAEYANLADVSLSKMAVSGVDPKPIRNPNPYEAFLPRIKTVNDGSVLMNVIGRYQPNCWGLYDMHGNVAEWTLSDYVDYPYLANDGRNSLSDKTDKVVRGGSWRDRPKRATSTFRLGYRPYQKVYNVGFRIIVTDQSKLASTAKPAFNPQK